MSLLQILPLAAKVHGTRTKSQERKALFIFLLSTSLFFGHSADFSLLHQTLLEKAGGLGGGEGTWSLRSGLATVIQLTFGSVKRTPSQRLQSTLQTLMNKLSPGG